MTVPSPRVDRVRQAWCVWLTGIPGSGKSTVAHLLIRKLGSLRVKAQILSTDQLRPVLTPHPTYSEDERNLVYQALIFAATMLTWNGVNVIIDATGNRRRWRERARRNIKRFYEVYLKCPLAVCVARESRRKSLYGAPRAIYRRAFAGISRTVPGVGSPYEAPRRPALVLPTDRVNPDECAEQIIRLLCF